jgi:hypothetical protein
MKASWENCLICGKETRLYLRELRVLGGRLGAIHHGRCYVEYLKMIGEIRKPNHQLSQPPREELNN